VQLVKFRLVHGKPTFYNSSSVRLRRPTSVLNATPAAVGAGACLLNLLRRQRFTMVGGRLWPTIIFRSSI
jgi:hypothetical protein